MATVRAPKQWSLTTSETITSIEAWENNLKYILSLDPNFASFLTADASWLKKTNAAPLRGFTDDGEDVPAIRRRTADQRVSHLEMMLGQIANYSPLISRNTIVRNSTSVNGVWQSIRQHYGLQSTGSRFLDLANIKLKSDQRPEDLYQCLMAFVEENLLSTTSGITHHGQAPEVDEELSPSLENFVVLTWLQLIHPGLPRLVKQRYGTELRSRTIASIKPEISQALDSLLDELRTSDEAKVMRSASLSFGRAPRVPTQSSFETPYPPKYKPNPKLRPTKSCPLCLQAGRPDHHSHFLSTCKYLPESDRKFMSRVRQVADIEESPDYENNLACEDIPIFPPTAQYERDPSSSLYTVTRRVNVTKSPYLYAFFNHHPLRLTIDTGAETNMIKAPLASYIGAKVTKSSQLALQADGHTPLSIIGETRLLLNRNGRNLVLEALVVEDLDVDVLAGTPFMTINDIAVRPAQHEVIIAGSDVVSYGSPNSIPKYHAVRFCHLLRAPPTTTTIWPGGYLEIDLPTDVPSDTPLAVEPRTDSLSCRSVKSAHAWPQPRIFETVGHKLRLVNNFNEPILIKKNDHLCQARLVSDDLSSEPPAPLSCSPILSPTPPTQFMNHSEPVRLDPDGILSPNEHTSFLALLKEFDNVFDPAITGYNGAVGHLEGVVNMGPVQPPQRKGRMPQYGRDQLEQLQTKFDELEAIGVFQRPENANVVAEYLNPSFLVKKRSGGFRLVTAFSDVGRYSKPQPSLMPDVDSTLRKIACWRYIIVTDLSQSFYQIPLSKDSQKYCGVATPFKGVRIYARCAMGMPGSETALEELMCRVLGDLIQEGCVAKIADDLFCGGNSPAELLTNWRKVLVALDKCDLRLSAKKTIISPISTTILGWVWSQGSIRASPHRIATLSSCAPPKTVRDLRAFIGSFKMLSRVIKGSASLVAPLENLTAGCQSNNTIVWSENLLASFHRAQKALSSNQSIVIPKPEDQLWIVTDGSVKMNGLGATLYALREKKLLLAGFFSAKMKQHQVTWLPCEVEALSIASAIKHFSPYIIQSKFQTCVLTDSKPCVQSLEKLCRGQFSSSPRVTTFLSTVSRYQISLRHLAGSSNLPSDFASRNAPPCDDPRCQICSFILQAEDSVVRPISVQDVMSGSIALPFTTRSAWLQTQQECQDLRRVHSHLKQGTRPSKKSTNIKDVKRYLHVASLSRDGLIVAKKDVPFCPSRECIVIPRPVIHGLLSALHVKLNHPSRHQLKQVVSRYFYALDLDKALDQCSQSCHLCTSLRKIPSHIIEQSTSEPPAAVGISFAADVIKRNRQLILVVRETTSSFTTSCIIEDERRDTLRAALLRLSLESCPLSGPYAVIRVDPAPGFASLVNDDELRRHRISIEIGRTKNTNKNPVAEKCIAELSDELLRICPEGGAVTPLSLAIATANLNTRIRDRGLSAREIWYQRDQFTNSQIPLSDLQLIHQQHAHRLQNHPFSERSKAPRGGIPSTPSLQVGDLVYLIADGSKTRARDRYLIVSIDGLWCNVRKFTGAQLRSTSYRVKLSECFRVHDKFSSPVRSQSLQHCSKDCIARENIVPDINSPSPATPVPVPPSTPPQATLPPPLPLVPEELSAPPTYVDAIPTPVESPQPVSDPEPLDLDEHTRLLPDSCQSSDVSSQDNEHAAPRRSGRQRHPPAYLEDFIT